MNQTQQPNRRPRVLQLSYACSPFIGSEAGVGWRRAVNSAKHFDTWVICEEHEFAADIRRYIADNGDIPGLTFVFVPINQWEWGLGRIHDSLWYRALHRWHKKVLHVARHLHERIGFDVVHQMTLCGYREPGYLWMLDAPFVWGPVGGTQNYPWRFLPTAGIHGAWYEMCRSVVNNLQLRFSRRVYQASRKAAVLMTANSTNQRDFQRFQRVSPVLLSDVGVAAVDDSPRPPKSRQGPLRILWSGQLKHHKALQLLILAIARLDDDVPCEVRVLGDGPLKRRWQLLAEKMGVAERITWMGWMPHAEALKQYDWADVFAFTSLRDTTGTVVLEALGAGLPVICLAHQGAGDVVTDRCGIKIPVTTPQKVIAGLADAVAMLARDNAVYNQLREGTIERAKEYLWSQQEMRMKEMYYRAMAN